MPGSRASFLSTSGRWLEIVVRQRNAVPCSSTRSRNASTGCRPPRSDADLAERLADHRRVRAADDLGVEEVAVPHPRRRTCSRTPCGTRGGTPRRAAARCAPPRRAGAAPRRPAPNSSKTTRSMPSAYTSNGTGRCCQRKLPPRRLISRASGPMQPDGVRVGLDVGGRQQAGLERVADDAQRLGDLRAEVERVLRCRGPTAGSGRRAAAATSAGAVRAAWRTSTAECASGRRHRRACRKAVAATTFRRSRPAAPRRASAPSAPARARSGVDVLPGGAVQAHGRRSACRSGR